VPLQPWFRSCKPSVQCMVNGFKPLFTLQTNFTKNLSAPSSKGDTTVVSWQARQAQSAQGQDHYKPLTCQR
jgi:hypothetical protein